MFVFTVLCVFYVADACVWSCYCTVEKRAAVRRVFTCAPHSVERKQLRSSPDTQGRIATRSNVGPRDAEAGDAEQPGAYSFIRRKRRILRFAAMLCISLRFFAMQRDVECETQRTKRTAFGCRKAQKRDAERKPGSQPGYCCVACFVTSLVSGE